MSPNAARLDFPCWRESGVSEEAQTLRSLARRMGDTLRPSISLTHPDDFGPAAEELLDTFREAKEPNWDGYGSKPASWVSLMFAWGFLITHLPCDIPEPEASVLPNGNMAFEWIEGKGKRLIISFGEDGMLTYASLWGESKQHGEERLGETIPQSIGLLLSRLVGQSK